MAEWQRSGQEPGRDYSDITINRSGVRNALRPTALFELSHAFGVAPDFAKFPRRP